MTQTAYGIAAPARRGVLAPSMYCQEAAAFFARLVTPPTAQRRSEYDALIRTLVAAGVWAKRDWIVLLAAADQATALTEFKGFGATFTAINAPSFVTDQGFAGSSGKFIDTTFAPSDGVQLQDNSANFSVYGVSDRPGGNLGHGCYEVNKAFLAEMRYSDDTAFAYVNDNAFFGPGAATTVAMVSGNRNGTARTIYRNGALGGSQTSTGSGRATTKMALCGYRSGASIATAPERIAYAAVGGSMTAEQIQAEYAAVHAYLQAVGAV
jgi:hypothetical protein